LSAHNKCPSCGSKAAVEARYCDHCGSILIAAPIPSRSKARPPSRISVPAYLGILLITFVISTLGGYRYRAEQWPWLPGPTMAVASPVEQLRPMPPQPSIDSQTVRTYLRSVVSLNVRSDSGNKTGAGFIIDDQGHVITVAHVVEQAKHGCLVVIDDGGKPHPAMVLQVDSNLDVALLHVPSLANWPTQMELGSSAQLTPGDPLYVMATPKGAGNAAMLPAEFGGVVANQRVEGRFFSQLLQVSGVAVLEGSSGGPLVDRITGKAVGIVNIGTGIQISYAIPIDSVLALVNHWTTLPGRGVCVTPPGDHTLVPLILAAVTPLSGPLGVWGTDLADGVELALRDVESVLHRVGYQVYLKRYDDQGNPTLGTQAARVLTFDQGVIGVVGSLDSQTTSAIAAGLEGSGLSMVAPVAGADNLTRQNWSHFNRLVASTGRQSQTAARFARERLQSQSVFVLHDGSVEGRAQAASFQVAAQVLSLRVASAVQIRSSLAYPELRKQIEATGADLIYFAGDTTSGISTVDGLRRAGVSLPILGSETLYDTRIGALAQAYPGAIYFTNLTADAEDRFQRHFETILGKPSRGYSAYGYDAARVILDALVRYGEAYPGTVPTRRDLSDLIRQTTKGHPGWSTFVTFDEKGENRTSLIFVYEWNRGEPQLRHRMQ